MATHAQTPDAEPPAIKSDTQEESQATAEAVAEESHDAPVFSESQDAPVLKESQEAEPPVSQASVMERPDTQDESTPSVTAATTTQVRHSQRLAKKTPKGLAYEIQRKQSNLDEAVADWKDTTERVEIVLTDSENLSDLRKIREQLIESRKLFMKSYSELDSLAPEKVANSDFEKVKEETRELVKEICHRMREISSEAGSTLSSSTRRSVSRLKATETAKRAELQAKLKYSNAQRSIREQRLRIEEEQKEMELRRDLEITEARLQAIKDEEPVLHEVDKDVQEALANLPHNPRQDVQSFIDSLPTEPGDTVVESGVLVSSVPDTTIVQQRTPDVPPKDTTTGWARTRTTTVATTTATLTTQSRSVWSGIGQPKVQPSYSVHYEPYQPPLSTYTTSFATRYQGSKPKYGAQFGTDYQRSQPKKYTSFEPEYQRYQPRVSRSFEIDQHNYHSSQSRP